MAHPSYPNSFNDPDCPAARRLSHFVDNFRPTKFRQMLFRMVCCHHPLTAPIAMPCTKYFCIKG